MNEKCITEESCGMLNDRLIDDLMQGRRLLKENIREEMSEMDFRLPEVFGLIELILRKVGKKSNQLNKMIVRHTLVESLRSRFEDQSEVLSDLRVHVEHLIEKSMVFIRSDIAVHLRFQWTNIEKPRRRRDENSSVVRGDVREQ